MRLSVTMSPRLKVALYAMVSTRNRGQTGELSELRDYVGRRHWEIVAEYVEKVSSRTSESRPQLEQLMNDAKRRKFDVIAVWKLDRFAHSLKHLVSALAELNAAGIMFVSLTDRFDLTTTGSRALSGIWTTMAQFERDVIRRRVIAGIKNARRHGTPIGRPRGSTRPKINVDMETVRARLAAGESLRAIARSLSVSPSLLVKRAKAGV